MGVPPLKDLEKPRILDALRLTFERRGTHDWDQGRARSGIFRYSTLMESPNFGTCLWADRT